MPGEVHAQLYLSLKTADAERLEALIHAAKPACVRLHVEDAGAQDVAAACRALCHAQDIPLLIAGPDDAAVAVARAVNADGVHLSGSPKATPWARRELGDDCIVGIDPGPQRHDAMIAAESGADYVSLAPDWPEDDSLPAEISWWSAMIETPMVVENAAGPTRAAALRSIADFVVTDARDAEAVAGAIATV